MLRFMIGPILVVTLALTALAAEPLGPAERLACPDTAKQQEAAKQIRSLFETEYAAKDRDSRKALAEKLLQLGIETDDAPAAKYVLYREARDLAAEIGEVETALRAVDELESSFEIDGSAERAALLLELADTPLTPEAATLAARSLLILLKEAVLQDRYDAASKMIAKAVAVTRKADDPALADRLKEWSGRVEVLRGEAPAFDAAMKALDRNPDDANAKTVAGRFLCLYKDEWGQGLRFLAEGSDAALKALAEKEIEYPKDPDGQIALADTWWDFAEKQPGAAAVYCKRRAAHWYMTALPQLRGLSKAKAEKRMAAASGKGLQIEIGSTSTGGTPVKRFSQYALLFDGAGAFFVGGGSSETDGAELTITAWIHPTAWKRRSIFFWDDDDQAGGDRWLELNGRGQLSACGEFGNMQTDDSVPLNKWTHVAFVAGTQGRALLINGQVRKFTQGQIPPHTGRTAICIGSGWFLGRQYIWQFTGMVCDVTVWRRSLTIGQITEIMKRRTTFSGATGLVAAFEFAEGSPAASNRADLRGVLSGGARIVNLQGR